MNDEGAVRQKTQVASPAELAAAREARGMSQLDISQRIKLQVKQVNALEEGQWDALPGKSFVRGALRSYGKLLDVDVAPLLESIGGFAEPAQVQGMKPLDTPIARSSGLGFNGGGRGSPILWVIAGLIGVVALVLYFGSDSDSSRIRSWLPSGETPSGTSSEPASPAPAAPAGSSPPPAGAGGEGSSSALPNPSSSAAQVGASGGPAGGGTGSKGNSGNTADSGNAGGTGGAGPTGPGLAAVAPDGPLRQPVSSSLQELPQAPVNVAPPAIAGGQASSAGAVASGHGFAGSPSAGHATPGGASGNISPSRLSSSSSPSASSPGSPGSLSAAVPAGSRAGVGTEVTLAAAATAAGSAASPGAAATGPSAAAGAADAKGVMQVKAEQDSWVEVRQADGTALHNGLLKGGASIELKGSPPYRVVLGNASHVELSYEGKPQDLAPHIRANNIARLQLR